MADAFAVALRRIGKAVTDRGRPARKTPDGEANAAKPGE